MVGTKNLGITLVEQNQAQKEVTVNEALVTLDSIFAGVIDKDLSTPPMSPSDGDLYIVKATGTGDWASHDNDLAHYNQGWRFITPVDGMSLWVLDEDTLYVWDGTAWILSTPTQFNLVGVNTVADSMNKLSVKSDAVLFASITNNSRVKVSKNAAGDTASHLFQTNFSARAEFGLIGNDDFLLKVSPDGSSFYESFVSDKDNGDIEFKAVVGYGEPVELTISAGAVTINKTNHIIDTESDASTDDLDTINGGINGQVLYLSVADDARTVVLKDNTGNLKLAGDLSLDSSDDMVVLQRRGGNWLELSRSNNG